MEFDFELDKIVKKINEMKAKKVLIQLPDGLKNKSVEILDYLSEKTNARIDVWGGSCFGACDLPVLPKNIKYDLIIHFGHEKF